MEPRTSAVVRPHAVAGNAAVTAVTAQSSPSARPGPFAWAAPMLLAGQNVIGNQAVAIAAAASPALQHFASAQQQIPTQHRSATQPQSGNKPGPKPAQKAKDPPGSPSDRRDGKEAEGRSRDGANTQGPAGPGAPGVAGAGGAGVVTRVEGLSLVGPAQLSLPLFARRFDASATLPPLRAGTAEQAADRGAMAAAKQTFAGLVDRSRRAHDAQLSLLGRLGRAAVNRHNRVDGQTRFRVADAEHELDGLRHQALRTVDAALQSGNTGLDLALRRGRGLVASASSAALRRIRANADAADGQITAIVDELASNYITVLEQSAVEITAAADRTIPVVEAFGAAASTLFPGGATPKVEAENEARRRVVPQLAADAVAMLRGKSDSQSAAYRAQFSEVRSKFDTSELAAAMRTRKDEIDTKGRDAVARATRTAYAELRKQTASGRAALRRMAADARESIELRHKAARVQLIRDANGLLQASQAQAEAELGGLATAMTTGLPAFERVITAVHGDLVQAAANGADGLRESAKEAAETTGPKVDQLGDAQRRLVTHADASTDASVAEAERTAALAAGHARAEAADALRAVGAAGVRGATEFVAGHVASFAATARGVRQVADAWAMPLTQVFAQAVRKTKKALTEPFTRWKDDTEKDRKSFIDLVFTPFLPDPAKALAEGLDEEAAKVAHKLETRESALVKAFGDDWGTDEKGVSDALRGMTPTQGRALSWMWEQDHHVSLDEALQGDLSGDDLDSARAYVRGDQAAGAAAELNAATGWFNDDEERIEAAMRNLTPEELSRLKGSKEGAQALADVRDNLGGTDLKVFDALAAGNQDRADAFRMKDKIDEARQSGDLDALHDTLIQYGAAPAERGRAQVSADERRVAVQRELAGIIDGADAARISPQAAAATVEKYALAPIQVATAGPDGGTQYETKDITGPNRDLAVALIHGGENSVEARAARLAVEAQRPGGPDMLKLDAALYDPRLKPGVPEDIQTQARADRDRVFQTYAAMYGGADKAGTPATTKAYLEGTLRSAYGDDTAAGDLAVRLAHDEYPTPQTAALAMKYATEGAGTDEELMFRFVERMDRDEIAAMRVEYKNLTGNALDDDLGTYHGGGLFTELSGDDRLRMEVALLGVPRNDREAAEVASFRMQQQRDETGWLGSWLAEDTYADQSLKSAETRLTATLGGATVRVDDKGNPVWSDAGGRPIEPGGSMFGKDGKYAGKDPREFASAVRVSKLAAEEYAAQIDSYASVLTTAVMAIGAVAAAVATVATGGAASPLLLAAIAGVTGLSSMAVHSAVSGGRYGWEQAAVDLGTTAVQALTAGVGQHLSIVARGGAQSLAAGMNTLRSVQQLGNTVGRMTGSALGDLLAIGAATGGMDGFGGALLDEATWSKGFGNGLAALLEATLTGALSGAASTVASQAIESLPVGRSVAGGPRPTLGEALNGSLPGRAGLRATASFLGGAAGRGAELGVGAATGKFQGDAGDILQEMGKAGLQSAVQESAAGPLDKPVQRATRAQDSLRTADHEPSGSTTRAQRMPDPGGPPSLDDLTAGVKAPDTKPSPSTPRPEQPETDRTPAKPLSSSDEGGAGAQPGLDPSPETIRQGTVRMEQHPDYESVRRELERRGYPLTTEHDSPSPRVVVRRVVDENGNIVRIEKEVHVLAGMRFLDLEHERGHVDQLTNRFPADPLVTDVVKVLPDGRTVPGTRAELAGMMTAWQDAITEYHVRLQEFLRLAERGVDPAVLREHAKGVDYWYEKYWKKGISKGRSPTQVAWAEQHFADITPMQEQVEQIRAGLGL